jgi:Type VI secretion system VasI, EvfG, VC_A0118
MKRPAKMCGIPLAILTVVDPIPIEPEPAPSTDELAVARTGTAASAVSAQPGVTRPTLMIVGAAGALAGIVLVVAFSSLRGDPPLQTASAASRTPAPAPAPTVVESAPAPTWTGQRKAAWAHDGSKTITLELQAVRDVPVWASRARPVLVVRCLSRATNTFVVLGTSTKFEDDTLRRTIRVQWDDGPETVQQWEVSDSAHELFAPDGVAFVRQLAKANRLRFGFTPFNAQPVTAEFAVQGFDQLASKVANTCGWRL